VGLTLEVQLKSCGLMSPEDFLPHTPDAVAVGVAVRDPNIRDVLLGLLRLSRMRAQGMGAPSVSGAPSLQIEVGSLTREADLLVGYISSPEDAQYFDAALRNAGNPPSVVLVTPTADARLVEKIVLSGSKVVHLPDDAQAIADAIRSQLTASPTVNRVPTSPRPGMSEAA
jgi:hypothetical protein